jgi:hypothetical protein
LQRFRESVSPPQSGPLVSAIADMLLAEAQKGLIDVEVTSAVAFSDDVEILRGTLQTDTRMLCEPETRIETRSETECRVFLNWSRRDRLSDLSLVLRLVKQDGATGVRLFARVAARSL